MRSTVAAAALALLAAVPTGCVAAGDHAVPSATPFESARSNADYAAQLDRAIGRLPAGKRLLVVFGADWCHDSRALAGWLSDPRFASRVNERFDVVFIDVAHPQEGKGRNLDLAARFGLGDLHSTPAMVVVDASGARLNSIADALAWRNAGSRSQDSIAAALAGYAR